MGAFTNHVDSDGGGGLKCSNALRKILFNKLFLL